MSKKGKKILKKGYDIVRYTQTYKSKKTGGVRVVNRVGFFKDGKAIKLSTLSGETMLEPVELLFLAQEYPNEFKDKLNLAFTRDYSLMLRYDDLEKFESFKTFEFTSGKTFKNFDEFSAHYFKYLNDISSKRFFGQVEFVLNTKEKKVTFDDIEEFTANDPKNPTKFTRGSKEYIIVKS